MLSLSVVLHARISSKRLARPAFIKWKIHTELVHYRHNALPIVVAECSPWHNLDLYSQTVETSRMPSQLSLCLAWSFQAADQPNSFEITRYANMQMIYPYIGFYIDRYTCRSTKLIWSRTLRKYANDTPVTWSLYWHTHIWRCPPTKYVGAASLRYFPTPTFFNWPKTCKCSL